MRSCSAPAVLVCLPAKGLQRFPICITVFILKHRKIVPNIKTYLFSAFLLRTSKRVVAISRTFICSKLWYMYNTLCEWFWIGSVVYNQLFATHQLNTDQGSQCTSYFMTQIHFTYYLKEKKKSAFWCLDVCLSAKQTQLLPNTDNLKRQNMNRLIGLALAFMALFCNILPTAYLIVYTVYNITIYKYLFSFIPLSGHSTGSRRGRGASICKLWRCWSHTGLSKTLPVSQHWAVSVFILFQNYFS